MPCRLLGIKGQGKTFVPIQTQPKNARKALKAEGIHGRTHPETGSAAQMGAMVQLTSAGDGSQPLV